jgi:hypothetical protein
VWRQWKSLGRKDLSRKDVGRMGKIWATCGHQISSEWMSSGEGDIATKGHTKEGRRCINYQVVCSKCKKWWEEEKLIFYSEEEGEEWMKGSRRRQ